MWNLNEKREKVEKVKKERLRFKRRVIYNETPIRYQTDAVDHFSVKSH